MDRKCKGFSLTLLHRRSTNAILKNSTSTGLMDFGGRVVEIREITNGVATITSILGVDAIIVGMLIDYHLDS